MVRTLWNNKYGYPIGIWFEYFWNPLEVVAGSKFGIEDDDCYQVAIATADYFLRHRYDEFIELSKKNITCSINDTCFNYFCGVKLQQI